MLSNELPATIGRYEVVQEIGRGGMGVVFLGRDPRIGRQVAIKLLDTAEEGIADRFLQEARSAGQLKHPNIITIHDFGEVDDGSERDGLPFIIMEFIEGTSLAGLIGRNDASLSMARKLALIEDLAAGLDYAHNKGVVHRDVKPANVMIDREGVLKILDFGIARVGGSSLTVNGSMMGTPSYMSPEQAQGRPVDRRSDVFAVGLVLYELLSGRQAFSGTFTKVLYAIVSEEPPSLDTLCPNLDPGLVSIVNKAIQKDEQHRYQTLADLASEVAQVRARIDTRAERFVDEAPAIEPSQPEALPPRSRTAEMREIAARTKIRQDRRQQQESETQGLAAASERVEQPLVARVQDVGEREQRPTNDTHSDQDSRPALSEPGVASDTEISAGLAASPPPTRRGIGATIGMTLAVVIPALLLGFWWLGRSSPEQRVADTKPVVRGDESPTGTKPTDLSVNPDSPVGTSSRDATHEPATPVRGSTRSSTGVVEPPRPLPAPPLPTGGSTSAHEPGDAANISTPAGPGQPNSAPPVGPAPPGSAPPPPETERVPPPPDPVTPRVPREPPPPAPQPVPPPSPVVVPGFDRGVADRILAEYVDAMRRLDFAAIQRLYPSAPNSVRLRIEALRKDYSQCDIHFSSFQVEPTSGPTEATVRASGVESCKRRTKQPSVDLPTRYQFRLVKDTTGNWVVSELLTQ